jgi:hypothetical protein
MYSLCSLQFAYLPLSGWVGFMDCVNAAEAWYVPSAGLAVLAAALVHAQLALRTPHHVTIFAVVALLLAALALSLQTHIGAYKVGALACTRTAMLSQ